MPARESSAGYGSVELSEPREGSRRQPMRALLAYGLICGAVVSIGRRGDRVTAQLDVSAAAQLDEARRPVDDDRTRLSSRTTARSLRRDGRQPDRLAPARAPPPPRPIARRGADEAAPSPAGATPPRGARAARRRADVGDGARAAPHPRRRARRAARGSASAARRRVRDARARRAPARARRRRRRGPTRAARRACDGRAAAAAADAAADAGPRVAGPAGPAGAPRPAGGVTRLNSTVALELRDGELRAPVWR